MRRRCATLGLYGLWTGGLLLGVLAGALLVRHEGVAGLLLPLGVASLLVLSTFGTMRGTSSAGAAGSADEEESSEAEAAADVPRHPFTSVVRRYQAWFQMAPVALVVENGEGLVEDLNRRAEVLFGCEREEMVGEPLARWVEGIHDARDGETRMRLAGTSRDVAAHCEDIPRPEGTSRVWSLSEWVPDPEGASPAVRSIVADALGRFAGRLAHDFNNHMTVVLGFGEMLRMSLADAARAERFLDELLVAGGRAAALARSLGALGHRGRKGMSDGTLTEVLEGHVDAMRELLGEGIALTLDVPADAPRQPLAAARVEAALDELCLNARAALPEGGEVRVSVRVEGEGEEEIAVLRFEDTGEGLPESGAADPFEPFALSREKGRGMGLARVLAVARMHGGSATVASRAGSGTAIELRFPLFAAPEDVSAPATSALGLASHPGV